MDIDALWKQFNKDAKTLKVLWSTKNGSTISVIFRYKGEPLFGVLFEDRGAELPLKERLTRRLTSYYFLSDSRYGLQDLLKNTEYCAHIPEEVLEEVRAYVAAKSL